MSELIRRINQNVVNNPDFTVIVDQGENNSFTFAQLDAYARRIAGKLSAMGVHPRDFVTIELPHRSASSLRLALMDRPSASMSACSPDRATSMREG